MRKTVLKFQERERENGTEGKGKGGGRNRRGSRVYGYSSVRVRFFRVSDPSL